MIRLLLLLAILSEPLAAQTARVEGIVRTVTGDPVPGASIQLVNGPGNFLVSPTGNQILAGFTAATDNNGKFTLENVAPGRNYRLLATKTGFLDARLPALLTLNAGDTVRDLVIEMSEQGVVTGRVADVNGTPLVNALVTLQQSVYANGVRQMVSTASQTTDDRGVYRFANLSPGRYYVGASDQTNRRAEMDSNIPSGQYANVRTYYPNSENIDSAKAIRVPEDGEHVDIVMRRTATFALRGRVIDEGTGAPIAGGRVVIVMVNGASVRANPYARQSGPDGSFAFTGMPPATYALELAATNPGVPRKIGRAEVAVVGADISDLTLRVGNGISLRGMVRVEGATLPASFFSIARSVVLTEGPERAALKLRGRVMNDGMFAIDAVPPARYVLSFTELPEELYVKSIRFADTEIRDSAIDLSSGRSGTLVITLSNKPAVIEGSVRNSKNETVPGIGVALWSKDESSIRHSVTDQNGNYRFAALPAGEYYVAAFPGVDPGILESREFVSQFSSESAHMEVSESAHGKLDAPILSAEKIAAKAAELP